MFGVRRRTLGQGEGLVHQGPRYRLGQEHPRRVALSDNLFKVEHAGFSAFSHQADSCGHLQPVMSGLSMPCSYACALQAICRLRNFSLACPPMRCSLGTRFMASIARLKRSVSLLIASSIGVLILPFSLYPRTCSALFLRA